MVSCLLCPLFLNHTVGLKLPWICTGQPLPDGLFPLPVGPRGGADTTIDYRPIASGCNKTRFIHVENALFTQDIPNYPKNGKLRLI